VRTIPRWRQISDDLLRRLQHGEFAEGVPGELVLAEEYRVSRGTIRQALGPLREQGIVGGAPGRRSYVIHASRSSGFGPMYSLRDAITAHRGEERSRVLAQRIVTSVEVSSALGLDPQTSYVHIAKLRYADDVPFAADRMWVAASIAEPLLDADLTQTSVYEVLRSRCGVEFDAGVEYTLSQPATGDMAERLAVEEGSPMLVIRRKSCLSGEPVELRDTCAVGARVRLTQIFGDASAVLNCRGGANGPVDIPWE